MHASLPSICGTYVVILRNQSQRTITVGRLGELALGVGYYLYVGSAFGPGGLRARVAHHLATSANPHWHIDYLRHVTEPIGVWFQRHASREEHRWATALVRGRGIETAHPRFGASDCGCASHLFFSEPPPEVVPFRRRLRSLGISGGARAWAAPETGN